jgi:hypothetical protein
MLIIFGSAKLPEGRGKQRRLPSAKKPIQAEAFEMSKP